MGKRWGREEQRKQHLYHWRAWPSGPASTSSSVQYPVASREGVERSVCVLVGRKTERVTAWGTVGCGGELPGHGRMLLEKGKGWVMARVSGCKSLGGCDWS